VCEQVQYILRDESMHLNFGLDLVLALIGEQPELWTDAVKQWTSESVREAVRLEYRHAEDTLPNGLLGLTHPMMKEYVQHIADRRLEKLGLPKRFGSENPFPWMSEIIDLRKEKNFFETRVTEYQTGGSLSWD
jgi:ribonucleoside-diphosphate reductase beta chain